ncbi:MAG TPA: SPW repeat protein [Chloroflexia bacterium]|nr:SPW repeat protein [Chloroflexia bacterium]
MEQRQYDRRAGTNLSDLRWIGWAGILGSLWLILGPFALGYNNSGAAYINDLIVGVLGLILTGFCTFTASQPATVGLRQVAAWVTVAAGVWLVFSPWILGFNSMGDPTWNNLITGALTIILAGYAAFDLTMSASREV